MVSSGISTPGNLVSTKDNSFNFTTKTDSNAFDFNKIMIKSISSNHSSKVLQDINKIKTNASLDDTSLDKSNSMDIITTSKTSNDTTLTETKSSDSTSDIIDNKTLTKKEEENDVDLSQIVNMSDDKKMVDVVDLLAGISEEIKKTFGITDEQLETALANLGITMQDLLKPNNLTNLVCEITGAQNALSLLTDSGLSEQLKSLMDFVNTQFGDLAHDMDISVEELKAYIENANKNQLEQVVESDNHNQIKANETVSIIKVQSEDAQNSINQDDTTKTSSYEQSKNELQSVVEAKVTVDTESESNGSMSNNSNESGENNHSFSEITNNLTQSIQDAFKAIISEDVSTINTVDVIKQIVEAAKVTVLQEMSSIEIQLNPENLGKINLSIVSKEGVMTAQITAETEAVKKAIENQISVLKENFNNQGIKVESVEVTVANHSFDANQNLSKEDSNQDSNNKKTNKPLRLDSIEDLQDDELSDEERRVMNMLKDNNSSVEYSA